MNDRSFDSVAHDAAGVSRRESIFALGAAGLMAAFAGPFTADAKKKGKKKNKKQAAQRCPPAPDLCAPQVGPCTTFLTTLCNGDPSCQESLACCSEVGTCDVGGFFSCLINSQLN